MSQLLFVIWIICGSISLAALDTDSVYIHDGQVDTPCCPNSNQTSSCEKTETCVSFHAEWRVLELDDWSRCRNVVDRYGTRFGFEGIRKGWHQRVVNDCYVSCCFFATI